MFGPNHTRTRRQRRHTATLLCPGGLCAPLVCLGELTRLRLSRGVGLHRFHACARIVEMCVVWPARHGPSVRTRTAVLPVPRASGQCTATKHCNGTRCQPTADAHTRRGQQHTMYGARRARVPTSLACRVGHRSGQQQHPRNGMAAPPVLHSANKTSSECLWLLCAC